ncbi:MAG TPA: KEOPS complex kinase/ATPase Bud32 [Poseidonia sp.]|nr:KEOPS complex kinase/ATPase Bud32 [Poseidonia sp.]
MAFIEHQRLHLGAEAEVWRGTWFGKQAVRKQRRPRSWRHADLDHRLGVRRMTSEARLLIRLRRLGLPVPSVWDLDLDGGQLVLQWLPGRTLLEVLNDKSNDEQAIKTILKSVGTTVRMLHREAITHGDLSSNNMLIDEENVYLIDFGLAAVEYEIERFGIDLHVLDEILGASHPQWPEAINWVLEGYLEVDTQLGLAPVLQGGTVPSAKEVLTRLGDIRQRVRYHG